MKSGLANLRPEGWRGSSWVEDPTDGESVCTVSHEGEDVAGKDPQTCGIRTPCRAFWGGGGGAGLQSTVLEVMTNPRPNRMTEWELTHIQLSCLSQLSPFQSTLLPRPRGPWDTRPRPQGDTENRGHGHPAGCQPGWTHMRVVISTGQQILENMWLRSNIIIIL